MDKAVETTIRNLQKNRMEVTCLPDKSLVLPQIDRWLAPGAVVGVGGSATLQECGVIDHLRGGHYTFLDRYAKDLGFEEQQTLHRGAFGADCYISGTNAITQDGQLYNVDGNSNRIAALAYGPRSVIIVAGVNKLVFDLAAAARRVQTLVAPVLCKKKRADTPCARLGRCVRLQNGIPASGQGCTSDERVCCNVLISAWQRIPGRIKVLLVDEFLGY